MPPRSDAIQLIGLATEAAAGTAIAMRVAGENAEKAAQAFEDAAVAYEALGLNADSMWAISALFRGITEQNKSMNFSELIGSFMSFAEVCK
jgi:hypothetical protein